MFFIVLKLSIRHLVNSLNGEKGVKKKYIKIAAKGVGVVKMNNKYKYWELWFDEGKENENGEGTLCIATHWSEEWHNVNILLHKEEQDISQMILDDIEFAKTIRGETVSSRSMKPALSEFKKIMTELSHQTNESETVLLKPKGKTKEVLMSVGEIEKLIQQAIMVIDSDRQYEIRGFLEEASGKCLDIRNQFEPM